MKEPATVVIGANYGDEGKGSMTDYHCGSAGADVIVVRFNGGAQAGHTVVAPDGRRHVFSHFGSGSLRGAATYLSQFFACHPLLFIKEAAQLANFNLPAPPRVLIDSRAPVTTPYDMLINQMLERRRGVARHGSCGVGFGETIERDAQAAYALRAGDLRKGDGFLLHRLDAIRRECVPRRLAAQGLRTIDETDSALLYSDDLLEEFIACVAQFNAMTQLAAPNVLGAHRRVVMEGAQGLLLDQQRGSFPFVTRSNTGLRNALAVAQDAGITALEVTYCTRTYLTRHGSGPLPGELPHAPYSGVCDQTNIQNEFQGALRFAHLDLDTLARAINADFADLRDCAGINGSLNLAVTCLDQVDDLMSYRTDGKLKRGSRAAFLAAIDARIRHTMSYVSYGPARSDVNVAGVSLQKQA